MSSVPILKTLLLKSLLICTGKPNTKRDLTSFLNKVDLAVFENEFLDPTLLHTASIASDTPVHPKPKL